MVEKKRKPEEEQQRKDPSSRVDTKEIVALCAEQSNLVDSHYIQYKYKHESDCFFLF